MRQIDHLVLPVTTLTLARSRLAALGFTVAPDARHPFGTGNCCVFFANRTYLEPVTVVDRAAADIAAAKGTVFVRRVKRFNERHGEGMAMLALKSEDAEADLAAFDAAGFGGGPPFRFTRPATQPDGSSAEIGVVLGFAEDDAAPNAGFFACQHLDAARLYRPELIEHGNGCAGVSAVTAIAEAPETFERFVGAAVGSGEDGAGPVRLMPPDAFREHYGLAAPDPRRGLLFAAIELEVAGLDRVAAFAGASAIRHDGFLVVPPAPGLSVALAFRAADG